MKRLHLLLALVLVSALSVGAGMHLDLFSLQTLQARHAAAVGAFHANPGLSYALFALTLTFFVILSIPGVLLCMLFAGSALKLWVAVPLVIACRAVGAVGAFLLSRYIARAWVARRFPLVVQKIDAGVNREGWLYLAMLRLAPVLPDSVINPGMGLTSMRAWTFFWVSAVGMVPYVLLYTAAGRQLATLSSREDLISVQWMALLAVATVLLYVGKRAGDRIAQPVP